MWGKHQSGIPRVADDEQMAAMWREICAWIERSDLGGWLPLGGGLALIALAMLLPAWGDLHETRRQLDQLSVTLADQTERLHRYQQLIVSVRNDDPMILQRLAWNELRLKPVGAEVLGEPPLDGRMAAVHERWVGGPTAIALPAPEGDSKLERLINGPRRPMVMLAGALLIGFGLFTSLRDRDHAA